MKVNKYSQNTAFGMQSLTRFNLSTRVNQLVDTAEHNILCRQLNAKYMKSDLLGEFW